MNKNQKSMLIAGWIMLPLGAAVGLFWGLPLILAGYASTSWQEVDGRITHSGVERRSRPSRIRRRHSGRPVYRYRADVRWTFEADGHGYEGNQIWIGQNWTDTRDKQDEIAAQYQVGQRVAVYYDPQDPTRSVLLPGFFVDTWAPSLICLFVAGLGGAFIVVAKR